MMMPRKYQDFETRYAAKARTRNAPLNLSRTLRFTNNFTSFAGEALGAAYYYVIGGGKSDIEHQS